jgi:succinoglycan biosynthesis transport protein ExoP
LSLEVQRLRTAQELQSSNVSVVREGTKAEQVQPKPIRNGILGGLLGLLVGTALVVIREGLNTRVRSPEEAEEILELPMMGRVPKPSRRARGLAMLDSPDAPESEAYRMIATNLGFVNLDRGAKSIMVTSAGDREGKSTTVANLAVALARAGGRVALIDFDLKRPSLDSLFDLDVAQFGVGVTGVALGQISLDDALIGIPVSDVASTGSLDVLLTGQAPPDSAQFIASQRVTDLMERLSDRYDVVLIDAAPMVQASDAVALAGKVDAVIVVTGLAQVRRGALEELKRILDSAPVAKLGFVLTGVPMEDAYRHVYAANGHGNGAGVPGGQRQRVS